MKKIKELYRTITWPIRRTYRKVMRVLDFIPILWKGYDFDYRYAVELFGHQLKRTADYMESDRAMTLDADKRAKRIRTAIELLDKVYDEEYGCEYQDKLRELYGENVFDCRWEPVSPKEAEEFPDDWKETESEFVEHHWEYEYWDNADEIKETSDKLFRESREKQERAHKLVWEFIEHNIRGWWD